MPNWTAAINLIWSAFPRTGCLFPDPAGEFPVWRVCSVSEFALCLCSMGLLPWFPPLPAEQDPQQEHAHAACAAPWQGLVGAPNPAPTRVDPSHCTDTNIMYMQPPRGKFAAMCCSIHSWCAGPSCARAGRLASWCPWPARLPTSLWIIHCSATCTHTSHVPAQKHAVVSVGS